MVIISEHWKPHIVKIENTNHSRQSQKLEHLNSVNDIIEEKPPILGSWKKIYFGVLLNLVVLIALFYFFSEAFK